MPIQEVVSHPGIVEKVENNHVFVKILAQSACSTCHAKGACTLADIEEKIVEVEQPSDRTLKSGDPVTIVMKRSTGNLAVFIGYILPFIVLLVVLVTMVVITKKEGFSALVALLSLVIYYSVIYLYRSKINPLFTFSLE